MLNSAHHADYKMINVQLGGLLKFYSLTHPPYADTITRCIRYSTVPNVHIFADLLTDIQL